MSIPEFMDLMLRTKRKEARRCSPPALTWDQIQQIYWRFVVKFVGEPNTETKR